MSKKAKWQFFNRLTAEELKALETDCLKRGIQVPIELDEDGNVLDGHNRLAIAKKHKLTYRTVVRTFKTDGERAEHVLMMNMARRHLKPHHWGCAFARLLKLKGVERGRGKWDRVDGDKTATVAVLSESLGVPDRTARIRLEQCDTYCSLSAKEKAAVDAGEIAISSVTKKKKQEKRHSEASREAKLSGKHSVVYADPPWKFGASTGTGTASDHYPTMETSAICALKVKGHVTKNAALFIWSTNAHLPDALDVMRAWGFEYKTCFVWVKDKATSGLGVYARGKHELLLIGTRGSMIPKDRPISVLQYARGRHSEKPEAVYGMIEKMYPKQSCLEMFARKARKGWSAYGNEAPQETRKPVASSHAKSVPARRKRSRH